MIPGIAVVTTLTAILAIEVRGGGWNVELLISKAVAIAADPARMIGSAVLEKPWCFRNRIRYKSFHDIEFSPLELRTIRPESLTAESCPTIFLGSIPFFKKTVQSNLFCAYND